MIIDIAGLEIGKTAGIGTVEGSRGLVDDLAVAELRRIDSRHPTR